MSTKVTMRYGSKNATGNRIQVQLAQRLFHNRYTCNTDSLLQKTEEDLWKVVICSTSLLGLLLTRTEASYGLMICH